MITLQHTAKLFNAGQVDEVVALRETNLHISAGEFLVLVGANGSGKTTLLNLIAGAVQPSSGKIFINSQEVTHLPEHRRSRWIARVFQNPLAGTAPELSILDNFRLAALRTQRKTLTIGINQAFKQKVQDKISMLGLGLENKLHQPIGTLSGGQRQALTLLMGVMDHTDILLLDEPTAALDPKSATVVMETAEHLIRQYQLTTVFITHNLRESLRYGNRLIQLSGGQIAHDLAATEKERLTMETLHHWFD